MGICTEDDDPMVPLVGHSISYRIATGRRQGRNVLTLQTLPAIDEPFTTRAGNVIGGSLPQGTLSPRPGSQLVHAGVAPKANECDKTVVRNPYADPLSCFS